jgi:RNA polymerase sigma-70 factor (ECF subfamily)
VESNPLKESSEEELINRARSGDKDAFCELSRRYHRRVFSLALFYRRNVLDAEDLSQDVWLKAYKAIRGFRSECAFYTWLRQITINTFLNTRRDDAARRTAWEVRIEDYEAGPPLGSGPYELGFEAKIHDKILTDAVMSALGSLTDKQRMIFLLKFREGMVYDEIASALDCSPGTVKKSIFRAVAKLRSHFETGKSELVDPAAIAAGEKL